VCFGRDEFHWTISRSVPTVNRANARADHILKCT
jgi:hypothetical protein